MNSRERILAAISHERLDRVPTDIWATAEVWAKLRRHFGSESRALSEMHIDGIAYILPAYLGPPMPQLPAGQTYSYWSFWGIRYSRVDYATGAYEEQVNYPLADAVTMDDLDRYQWPSPDWFDYKLVRKQVRELHERRVVSCGYMAPFYMHNMLRGIERSLMDPFDCPEFTQHLMYRISDFTYQHHLRIFETCEGLIDVAQVTDDYGSQTGPIMSLNTFRELYKPHLQRFIDLCHSFGIKVFHHDDGAMRSFLPDLVDMGIDILNPIQHGCPGMEMESLKNDFGSRICFHGAVDNQQILPFGTPEDVRSEVRRCIDSLASDGTGYILAPCHNLQNISQLENIAAMYDEAWNYGKF